MASIFEFLGAVLLGELFRPALHTGVDAIGLPACYPCARPSHVHTHPTHAIPPPPPTHPPPPPYMPRLHLHTNCRLYPHLHTGANNTETMKAGVANPKAFAARPEILM